MDCSVRVWDTNELVRQGADETSVAANDPLDPVGEFKLDGAVYQAVMSPLAPRGGPQSSLIACATNNPQVRLCDVVSGSNTHALVGHTRAVHTVCWHPTSPFALASGSADGTIRIWDIRRAGCLMLLDQHNSVDAVLAKPDQDTFLGHASAPVQRVKHVSSHNGGVMHLQYSADGLRLLSSGQDRVLRSWDAQAGLNTLVNFGPGNSALSELKFCRFALSQTGKHVIFPMQREVPSRIRT
jgi:DNA excision repair protein ERCC-8